MGTEPADIPAPAAADMMAPVDTQLADDSHAEVENAQAPSVADDLDRREAVHTLAVDHTGAVVDKQDAAHKQEVAQAAAAVDKPASGWDTLEAAAGIRTAGDTEQAEYTQAAHAVQHAPGLQSLTRAQEPILRPSYMLSAIVRTPQSHAQTHSSY